MMNLPLMTVAVPCYTCAERVGPTVEAITANDFADFELLLAEGGSTDRTLDVLRELALRDSRIRVLAGLPADLMGKRNAVLAEARGRLLAFTDDDCLPAVGWLGAYAATAAAWPSMMTGAALPAGPGPAVSLVARAKPKVWRPTLAGRVAPWRPGGGLNFCVPTELARAVGGWDSRYPIGEDVDFNLRVLRSGHAIRFVPEAVVYHAPLADWDAYVRKRRSYACGLILLMRRKYGRTLEGWCTIGLSFAWWLGLFVLGAVRLRRTERRTGWACLRGGLGGLFAPSPNGPARAKP